MPLPRAGFLGLDLSIFITSSSSITTTSAASIYSLLSYSIIDLRRKSENTHISYHNKIYLSRTMSLCKDCTIATVWEGTPVSPHSPSCPGRFDPLQPRYRYTHPHIRSYLIETGRKDRQIRSYRRLHRRAQARWGQVQSRPLAHRRLRARSREQQAPRRRLGSGRVLHLCSGFVRWGLFDGCEEGGSQGEPPAWFRVSM